MELEQIVKKFEPLTGVDSKSLDVSGSGKVILPSSFIDTLKSRQKVEDSKEISLYYRVHSTETPHYMELTDYFPQGTPINFSNYNRISFSDKNRLIFPAKVINSVGFDSTDTIVFVGDGNRILMYSQEGYDRYFRRGINFLSISNAFRRLLERYSLAH